MLDIVSVNMAGDMPSIPIPGAIARLYEVHEWRNAFAVLAAAHPDEWGDICTVLEEFRLYRSEIVARGGGLSPISIRLNNAFLTLGWVEKMFDTSITVDEIVHITPTHKVDCFKNRIALEIEWNNKDPFFDRDLNNFRLLFDLRAISAGIIITKADELRPLFEELMVWSKFGTSTTWMRKLMPRIEGGGGGGCPIAVFAIQREAYVDDS